MASRTRADKKQANEQLILNAAADLFFERGYAGTTVDAICERLNATKPFVYYYFKSKSEILDRLSVEAAAITLSTLRTGARGKVDADERLRGAIRTLVTSHVYEFKAGALYYQDTDSLGPDARATIRSLGKRFHLDLVELLNNAVSAGVIPKQDTKVTALAIGGIVGFMYTWYKPTARLTAEEVIEHLTTTMLRATGLKV